jgi:hypothetical protein
MILLPTKGRPHLLARFLDCCIETNVTETILLIYDGDDDRVKYEKEYKMPFPVLELVVPQGTTLNNCFNAAYEKYPDEVYYGLVSDDCTPETPRWDVKLKEACQTDKIAWPAEGIHNEKLPGFVFLGGDLVRKMGFIYPPSIKHWFTDNLMNALQLKCGIGIYLPHVMLRHRHMVNGLAPEDDTYRNQPDHDADGKAYAAFLKDEFAALVERVQA